MSKSIYGSLGEDELLILHIGDQCVPEDVTEPVGSMSYEKIVENTNIDRIDELLTDLEDEDKISSTTEDEKKYFHLTKDGEKAREEIWEDIKEEKIILIDDKDTLQLKLKNIRNLFNGKDLIAILENINEENILDLRTKDQVYERLVGREEKFQEIKDMLDRIREEPGKAILISGDTGIGKTRLVEELKRLAIDQDFDFLKGKCHHEAPEPYQPFKSALDKFLEIEKEMGKFESVISPSQKADGKVQTRQMFDAQRKSVFYGTTKFLETLTEYRPLVLFLDDLQWADKGTLNLLDYMTDKLKDKPVLIVCTYRPGDVSEDDPLSETMRRMSRKRLYEEIELKPLETESIEKLIKEITQVEEVPKEFVKGIEEKTNGNPLFIKENVNQMIEEKLIDPVEGSFPSESKIVLVPDVVQDVIEKRVYKLNDDVRDILQLGSVIGRKIPFELLAEASEQDELEILEKIDELLENNIWREHPREESFLFSHDLLVDTIYQGTGKWLERKSLHNKVAEAIENIYESQIEEKYSILGRHFKIGEQYERSFEYFKKAGEKAERVYSHEDAVERYRESLEAAEKAESVDEEELFFLMEKVGEAVDIIGDSEEARKYFDRALTKAEDVEKKRRAYRKIARCWSNQGEFKKVISTADKGLSLYDEEGIMMEKKVEESEVERDLEELEDSPEICRLLSQKGWALRRIGKSEEAKKIFEEELEKAKDIDDVSVLSQAYHDLGSLQGSSMYMNKNMEYLQKSIDLRKEILQDEESFEQKYGLSRSYNNVGIFHLQRGNLNKSLEYLKKALDLHREINNKLFEAKTLINLAIIYTHKGELEKTEDILDDAFDMMRAIEDKQGLSRAEVNEALLYIEKGKIDKALDDFESSLETFEEIGNKIGVASTYIGMSRSFMFKGDMEKSKEYIEKAYEIAGEIKSEQVKVDALIQYGRLERLTGDPVEAVELHEKNMKNADEDGRMVSLLMNRAELIEDYIAKGELDRARELLEQKDEEDLDIPDINNKFQLVQGILHREEGNLEEAEDEFKRCLEEAKELSKKYRIARIHYELGKLYKAKENGEKAEESLEESERLYEEMDMEYMLERCRNELE